MLTRTVIFTLNLSKYKIAGIVGTESLIVRTLMYVPTNV